MNRIANYPFIHKPLSLAIVLVSVVCVTACSGGAIHFDGGNSAQVSVDENTTGVVWKSVALVDAQGSPKVLVYKLSGADAAQFSINSTSGELAFKQPADFEVPLDSDKDNEYVVDIEASYNSQYAVQSVHIKVKDVTKPVISLVKPQLNENVGKGDSIEVETLVRFYDAESNTVLNGNSVTLDASPLIQDASDPQLWRGKVVVPEDGINLSLAGVLVDRTPVKSSARLFNKRYSINPSYLGVNPGIYLAFFDPFRGVLGKLNLKTHIWNTYVQSSTLQRIKPVFDFNSGSQYIYVTDTAYASTSEIFAFGIASSSPTAFSTGCLSGVVTITYDNLEKRVLVLTKNKELGVDKYKVMAIAVDPNTGFVDGKAPASFCNTAAGAIVWDLPADVISGSFKNFNFNRVSKTYILADERTVNGSVVTAIQGFSEAGEKRFEAHVGPDISNLAVNQAGGIIYVAERHSSAAGKLKTIDISTGEVGDLVESYNASAVGGYTDLRMDNVNKRLYVGDDVSDSIFEVDLATKSMTEVKYSPADLPQ